MYHTQLSHSYIYAVLDRGCVIKLTYVYGMHDIDDTYILHIHTHRFMHVIVLNTCDIIVYDITYAVTYSR